ncbi:hypothetical protein ACIQXF_07340 [Lysinibacillus sp. NPDC097231]|uniref:hypothetical protein n=1 Tax=Lysinibacillus sp. NPDC097231 TaxID=3364142 RepID=UPI00382C787E
MDDIWGKGFLHERIKRTKRRVYETGAGSGRFLIPFLERGYHVEGGFMPTALFGFRRIKLFISFS